MAGALPVASIEIRYLIGMLLAGSELLGTVNSASISNVPSSAP